MARISVREFVERLQSLSAVIETNTETLNRIQEIANLFSSSLGTLNSVVSSHADKGQSLRMLTEEFRKSRATILTLKMGKTFVGIDKLRAQFSKFPFPKALSHHHPFTGIVEAIDTFEKRYEAFLEDGTPVSTLEVIVSAMMLRRSIAAIEDFVHATVNILDPPFEPEKGCGILSLFLTSSEDYSSTIEKMAAVEGMYVELCNLLNVSTSGL